jgi:rhamnosyltransferase subunit B
MQESITSKSELILANVGTFGDAHPFIAIGHAMLARGHTVSMFSNLEHRAAIESAGITFIETNADIDYSACIGNPNFWHPIKGLGVYWRSMLVPSIVPLYQHLQNRQNQGKSVHVVAGPFMLGARLAQLHLGTRLTSAYTAPSMLRTLEAPVCIAHTHWPAYTPRIVLRAVWKALDHYKLEPMARKKLNHICTQLSVALPPPVSIFDQWMHSPEGLALFPEWFAPRKADYPGGMQYASFPRYQLDAQEDLSPALRIFLAQGTPPVVVTLGTGMAHASEQFSVLQKALRQTDLRAIFLSKQPSQLPDQPKDSTQFFYCDYAPFSKLLPRCAAIVHHGGIGTSAQALAAGIPQLVQSQGHDQFENARCLAALGVGQRLTRDAQPIEILRALQHWVNHPQHKAALAKAQAQTQGPNLQATCEILEAHG